MGFFGLFGNKEDDNSDASCPLESNDNDGLAAYFDDDDTAQAIKSMDELSGYSPEFCQSQGRSCDECTNCEED